MRIIKNMSLLVGAAVANAIHNATGVRVRDYPITLDKLIDKTPAAGP